MLKIALIDEKNIVENIVIGNTEDDFKTHPDYLNHTHVNITDLEFPNYPSVGWSYDGSKFIAPEPEPKTQLMIEHEKMLADYEAALAKIKGAK